MIGNNKKLTKFSNIDESLKPLDHQPIAPASITAYKQHGITRKNLHSLCLNFFHFPHSYRDCLAAYWIYHWSGRKFSDKLFNGTIHIHMNDLAHVHRSNVGEYLVIYQDCTPYVAKKAHELRLSFRKPKKEFNIPGYVIVRVIKENLL